MHTKSPLKLLTANLHPGRRKSQGCAVVVLEAVFVRVVHTTETNRHTTRQNLYLLVSTYLSKFFQLHLALSDQLKPVEGSTRNQCVIT